MLVLIWAEKGIKRKPIADRCPPYKDLSIVRHQFSIGSYFT